MLAVPDDYEDPLVLECPRCGQLWVGRFSWLQYRSGSIRSWDIPVFSEVEVDELTGYLGHAPADQCVWRLDVAHCRGIPETVYRPDVLAAYHLGGKAAAKALTNGQLRDAVRAEEQRIRGE